MERKEEKTTKKKEENGRSGHKNKREEGCSDEKNIASGKKESAEEATHSEEGAQDKEFDKRRVEETCLEVVQLEDEKKKIEVQKRRIEESLTEKQEEAFQLVEATGVSVPHPFEEDFTLKDPFVQHLEESIKEKKANLECPVCLEVKRFVFLLFS